MKKIKSAKPAVKPAKNAELAAAYKLLGEALPLAIMHLRYFPSSALDQSTFWLAVDKFGDAADIDVVDFMEDDARLADMFYNRQDDLGGM